LHCREKRWTWNTVILPPIQSEIVDSLEPRMIRHWLMELL